jgi:hypothetical protein
VVGVLIMIFGGLSWFLYESYHVLQSLSIGTFEIMDLFWLLVSFIFRGIVGLILGGILFFTGRSLLE